MTDSFESNSMSSSKEIKLINLLIPNYLLIPNDRVSFMNSKHPCFVVEGARGICIKIHIYCTKENKSLSLFCTAFMSSMHF